MLYIMRHGKTDWNGEYRLQGTEDIPLNEEGIKMAHEAGKKYRDTHFDVCFSSPLSRAKKTAELFLEGRDIPLFFDDRLHEICFGKYEGSRNVFEHPENPLYNFFMDTENYTAPEGAETFEELFKRIKEFLEEKAFPLLKEGKDVLIVAHGAFNSGLITYILDKPLKEFWSVPIDQCRVVKIDIDEKTVEFV